MAVAWFACKTCDYTTNRSNNLKRHELGHTSKPRRRVTHATFCCSAPSQQQHYATRDVRPVRRSVAELISVLLNVIDTLASV